MQQKNNTAPGMIKTKSTLVPAASIWTFSEPLKVPTVKEVVAAPDVVTFLVVEFGNGMVVVDTPGMTPSETSNSSRPLNCLHCTSPDTPNPVKTASASSQEKSACAPATRGMTRRISMTSPPSCKRRRRRRITAPAEAQLASMPASLASAATRSSRLLPSGTVTRTMSTSNSPSVGSASSLPPCWVSRSAQSLTKSGTNWVPPWLAFFVVVVVIVFEVEVMVLVTVVVDVDVTVVVLVAVVVVIVVVTGAQMPHVVSHCRAPFPHPGQNTLSQCFTKFLQEP
mmetsp:Transcript_55477/g.161152  ORF Transcript_55477/g.161152 Transcript_55477/m.161152 type:complete len:282 (+) Transcript_55477:906-1751(+)